jgi:hypothetical protein
MILKYVIIIVIIVIESVRTREKQFFEMIKNDALNNDNNSNSNNDKVLNVLCLSHGGFLKDFIINFCDYKLSESLNNCIILLKILLLLLIY